MCLCVCVRVLCHHSRRHHAVATTSAAHTRGTWTPALLESSAPVATWDRWLSLAAYVVVLVGGFHLRRHLRRWLPRITRDVSTPPVTRRSLLCTHNNFCILWFQFSLSMPSTVNYSGCTYPLCSEFLHLLSTVHVLILPLKPYSVYELQANHNRMHTTA